MQATRRIPRARRRESVCDVLLDGVPGAEPRGSERGDQHERDDDETEQRRPPTGQTSEERQPLAPRDEPIGGDRDRRGGHCIESREAAVIAGWPETRCAPAAFRLASFIPPAAEPGVIGGWPETGAPRLRSAWRLSFHRQPRPLSSRGGPNQVRPDCG